MRASNINVEPGTAATIGRDSHLLLKSIASYDASALTDSTHNSNQPAWIWLTHVWISESSHERSEYTVPLESAGH